MVEQTYSLELAKENKELLLRLVNAQNENQAEKILKEVEGKRTLRWWPFGGNEENFGTINNQQTDPIAALTEKPINSIDSLLLRECRLRGIDPEGGSAPKTMSDAVEFFFQVKDGDISNLEEGSRRKLAKNVRIIAQGEKDRPCIIVADQGEGQSPANFKNTLLSLHRRNKARIPFVQGKYGMGGTGVIPFCGSKKYELILSKRDPKLLGQGESDVWGFTLVRKTPEERLTLMDKHSWFECLVDDNDRILTFDSEFLEILPAKERMYHGCYIKMFDYDLPSPSFVTTDLWRDLNRRLYSPALPILIQEDRTKYLNVTKGKNDTKVLVGNKFRIKKDDRHFLRETISIDADLGPFGHRKVDVVVFKDEDKGQPLRKNREWTTYDEAIFLTVNGQTHNTIPRYWLEQKTELNSLANYMLVHIDCTDVSRAVADDIFLGSRDRVRNNEDYRAFQTALETALKENAVLQKLNEEYRQRQIARIVPDKSIARSLVASIVSKNPILKGYFGLGEDILTEEVGNAVQQIAEQFTGVFVPTYLKPLKKFEGEIFVKEIRQNARHAIVLLGTDAQNDYFDRTKNNGKFMWHSNDSKAKIPFWYLYNGIIFTKVTVEEPIVGEEFDFSIQVTRPRMNALLTQFRVKIIEPRIKETRKPNEPHDQGLKIPQLVVVRQDPMPNCETWDQHGWGLNDIAKVDAEAVYVNLDSNDLRSFVTKCSKELLPLAETLYKIGIYLNSIIFDMEFKELDTPQRPQIFTSAIKSVSKTLLPLYLDPRLQKLAEA